MKKGINRKAVLRVLAAAECQVGSNVFSSCFFARKHISIVDQQQRSFELAHALILSERIPKHSHVAIVGAGFSGLTLAVALAARVDAAIHVFEKDSILLRRFREAPFRFVHPRVNSIVRERFSLTYDDETEFPFLNWRANYAHLMASDFSQEFMHYAQTLPIALHRNCEVLEVVYASDSPPVLRTERGSFSCFNLIVLADGFGTEKAIRNEHQSSVTNDLSYWWSGRVSDYRPTQAGRRNERVLIVGNGDSAIVELAHYLLPEFHHREIMQLLPVTDSIDTRMVDSFLSSVEQLWHRQIEEDIERDTRFPDQEGPIAWYWSLRDLIRANPSMPSLNPINQEKGRIRTVLKDIWKLLESIAGPYEPEEDDLPSMNPGQRRHLSDLLDALASFEIERFISRFGIEQAWGGDPAGIRSHIGNRFKILVSGSTPSIYSRRQAPLNWFLLGFLSYFGKGKFRYLQKRTRSFHRGTEGIKVRFQNDGQREEIVDRLVVRAGPQYDTLSFQNEQAVERGPDGWRREQGLIPPLLGSVKVGGSYKPEIIEAFRTQRWRRAISTPVLPESFRGLLGDTALRALQAQELLYILVHKPDSSIQKKAARLFIRSRSLSNGTGRESSRLSKLAMDISKGTHK